MLTQDIHLGQPSIYQFSGYRDYLNAILQPGGVYNQSEPLEQLAKKLGYRSPSSLSMVLNGRRLPTGKFLKTFAEVYKLSPEEKEYLLILVRIDSATQKGEDPTPYLNQLSVFNRLNETQQLDLKLFKQVSQWYYHALRYLLTVPGQDQDPHSLAKALKGRVKPKQISEALVLLEELKFIARDQSGRFEVTDAPWRTEKNVSSFAIRSYHAGMLQEALHSLATENIDQRYITGLTMHFNSKYQKDAIKDVQNFLEYFNKKYDTEQADEVKQLNIQLFSLARRQKEEKQ